MTEFDYIIAGGGTAGCVLAARLTEDPSIRVLVAEAGTDQRTLMHRIPAGVLGLYQSGRFHWDYRSEPETCAAGQEFPYKMGKGLGGSSSINALLWVRGAPAVFDGWAEWGATGWSWQDIEPVYRRIERFSDASDPHMGTIGADRGHQGKAGIVGVQPGVPRSGCGGGPSPQRELQRSAPGGNLRPASQHQEW